MTSVEIDQIRLGALLHDVGKLAVPRAILDKPGPLTAEVWGVMRRHPTYAKDLLTSVGVRQEIVDTAYTHHERWDGKGYPQGLRASAIPLVGRVVAVADVADALMSKRTYREALPPAVVRSYVAGSAGTQLDPRVVETFVGLPTA
jgi:putative nucleotidyltransferase with HDIG domain